MIIRGEGDSYLRSLRLACRRHPRLQASDPKSVSLFTDFLGVLVSEAAALEEDTLRLGLVVSAPDPRSEQLATLAEVARRQSSSRDLQEAVKAPGAYDKNIPGRLDQVVAIVRLAGESIVLPEGIGDSEDLTWRLLRSLYVVPLSLEGAVASARA